MSEYPEEIKKKTLKWVNKLRREHGKSNLPRLRKGDNIGGSCPITNSLKDCFEGKVWTTRTKVVQDPDPHFSKNVVAELPDEAKTFITFHAKSMYPELLFTDG